MKRFRKKLLNSPKRSVALSQMLEGENTKIWVQILPPPFTTPCTYHINSQSLKFSTHIIAVQCIRLARERFNEIADVGILLTLKQ